MLNSSNIILALEYLNVWTYLDRASAIMIWNSSLELRYLFVFLKTLKKKVTQSTWLWQDGSLWAHAHDKDSLRTPVKYRLDNRFAA